MARRSNMSRSKSRRVFQNGIKRHHPKNRYDAFFMRGGIRL